MALEGELRRVTLLVRWADGDDMDGLCLVLFDETGEAAMDVTATAGAGDGGDCEE